MSDIKLFHIAKNKITELEGKSVAVEKSLQTLIETHLEAFLGVIFLAAEYSTGIKHGGRIDTLGIDENNCPVIIEYKRATNENVINQGLYYLDWLLDHKAEFQLLTMKKVGKQISDNIEWNNARLICIAGDYTKFDSHAVQQINRNIELIRYKRFDDLLLLELVNARSESSEKTSKSKKDKLVKSVPSVSDYFEKCSSRLKDLYHALDDFILSLGDGIQLKKLERYFAYKKIKTFASLKFQPQTNTIVLWLKLNPSEIKMEKGFSRDVTKTGHHGIGSLEVRIKSTADLERAKPLILKSYESN